MKSNKKTNLLALKLILIFAVSLLTGVSLAGKANSAGFLVPRATLTASASSATTNSSGIKITAFIYRGTCQTGDTYEQITKAECDAKGGTYTQEPFTYDGYNNFRFSTTSGNLSNVEVQANSSGYATTTLTSASVGSATVTLTSWPDVGSGPVNDGVVATIKVSFTAPKAAPPAPKPAAPPAPTKPTTPTVATISVKGETVTADQPVVINEDEPLILSGKTVANGVVTLYIFSDPKTAQVTADKDGNWSYEISGLPPDEHRVEMEVTDPATKLTSDRAQVLAFTVEAAEKPAIMETQSQLSTSGKSINPILMGGLAAVILAVCAGTFFAKKKHLRLFKKQEAGTNPLTHNTQENETESEIAPSASEESDKTREE